MPTTYQPTTSIYTSGTDGFTLNADENLIVDIGIMISAPSSNVGILLTGSAHLTLNGIASGGYGVGTTGLSNVIDISSTGTAIGQTDGIHGGGGATIHNFGMISGNNSGVYMRYSGAIENHGTIQANQGAYSTIVFSVGDFTLVNSGTIRAATGGTAILATVGSGGTGDLTPTVAITNTGTIIGKIQLSFGDDFIDTRLGTIQGRIDLGDGSDTIKGSATADNIFGGVGNDVLIGNGGGDFIEGWVGRDYMTGNSGADKFIFKFATNTGKTTATADIISDFKHSEVDRVDLSGIDANSIAANNQAFSFIGTAAFTGVAGQLHYGTSGGNALVSGDLNGDKVIDFVIQLNGVTSLTAGDFVL